MFVFIPIITGLLACCVGCLAGYLATQQWRKWRRNVRMNTPQTKSVLTSGVRNAIRSHPLDYNRITELEQIIYGHMWPNPDSPWNQAAITQMRAMEVQRRQKEIAKKQQSAVVQTLMAILGRERNGR